MKYIKILLIIGLTLSFFSCSRQTYPEYRESVTTRGDTVIMEEVWKN